MRTSAAFSPFLLGPTSWCLRAPACYCTMHATHYLPSMHTTPGCNGITAANTTTAEKSAPSQLPAAIVSLTSFPAPAPHQMPDRLEMMLTPITRPSPILSKLTHSDSTMRPIVLLGRAAASASTRRGCAPRKAYIRASAQLQDQSVRSTAGWHSRTCASTSAVLDKALLARVPSNLHSNHSTHSLSLPIPPCQRRTRSWC